ncbi:minichromosome maintenance component complex 9-like protein (nucleomorph) [Chroomonas mesostigmatica CCMP1168]|uniref:Minichromosome maintenance component complex 9-like protein n=1 Tax=Chroomonas mesostigmatica CCMP1168 TaxID=1195612 RepID=J7G1N6_9CRYP|nr:minichromosome maintenance component complex 9-like protein [Chroomonas mesostigmatica CCMP1168]
MCPKEFLQVFILSVNKINISPRLKSFLKKINHRDKSFLIDKVICINGFLASNIFLIPLKISSAIKLFEKYLSIKLEKFFTKNFKKKRKIFPPLNYSWAIIKKYLPKTNIFDPKKVGQMTLIQGLILQIKSPMIKKITKIEFLNGGVDAEIKSNSWGASINLVKNFRSNLTKKKNKKYLIKYQEAKILILKFQIDLKQKKTFSNVLVFFVGKMVGKFNLGSNVSILGIIKKKNYNHAYPLRNTFKTDFIMETVFLKIEKKKTKKKKYHEIYTNSLIDFGNIWQDSKIRSFCYVTRNSLFVSFFHTNEFSFFTKFIFLLSLIGGCTQLTSKNQKIRGSINCCIIDKSNKQKYYFLKEFQDFWRDNILFSDFKHDRHIVETGNFKNKAEVHPKTEVFSKSGTVILDNYKILEEKILLFLKNYQKKIQLNFLNNDATMKFKTLSSIFFIIKGEEFFKENFRNLNKSFSIDSCFSDESKFNFYKFIKNFDTFFFIRDNDKFFKKKNVSFFFLFQKIFSSNIIQFFFFPWKKNLRKWSMCKLGKFINFVKSFVDPVLEKKAENYLIKWYLIKNFNYSNIERKIVIFEKLVRISQANARFFWRDVATIQDCIIGVYVVNNNFFLTKKLDFFYNDFHFPHRKVSSNIVIKNFQKITSKNIVNSSGDFFSLAGGNLAKNLKKFKS